LNLLAVEAMSMKKSGMPMIIADAIRTLPGPLLLLPFVLQLLAIALLPFLHPHWWERHYAKVSALLAGITLAYYLLVMRDTHRPMESLHEYIGFIVLMTALFIVAGGIHIGVEQGTTPGINVLFLIGGAFLANIIGTTGASMLLIRPWVRMNRMRIAGFHTVFFIFLISNVGGCLTPIGDPPLFLGFLKGVPFWWTLENLWKPGLLTIALLSGIFFLLDRRSHRAALDKVEHAADSSTGAWTIEGLGNLVPLAVILTAIFLDSPWRELVMGLAALLSWRLTPQRIHRQNEFSFAPIQEVAWLFLGIFATMMPALDYLEHHATGIARDLGMGSAHFYYFTGILSSLLDNAPTYLSFLSVELGLQGGSVNKPEDVLRVATESPAHLIAISLGAVLFGAMTYIGTGPNFMVKSIVSASGVKTPGFFDYLLRYSLPILFPILMLVGWLFLH